MRRHCRALRARICVTGLQLRAVVPVDAAAVASGRRRSRVTGFQLSYVLSVYNGSDRVSATEGDNINIYILPEVGGEIKMNGYRIS